MDLKTQLYHRPDIFEAFPELIAAESTRHGGKSAPPYASLNVSLHTKDKKKHVKKNRRRLFSALGITKNQLAHSYQVHGKKVKRVKKAKKYKGYDALMTNKPEIFLAVTIADCAPILLYDPTQEVVAAIHAGWRGTVAGIVTHTLRKMHKKFDSKPSDCYAYIGTCIDQGSYEVDADVGDPFPVAYKRWDAARKKYFIDLKSANKAQLLEGGVPEQQISISPYSTYLHNEHFFSHRKEKGKTGRMLALIGMK
jgi:YfiH family protein